MHHRSGTGCVMSKIVDAVTAVLLCDGELLMVQRQPFLSAFPGYHAFPGGKIDAADSEGIALPAFCGGFEPRLLRRLLREIIEELSVDLSKEPAVSIRRSEERSVGNECDSTCQTRWLPYT